MANEEPLATSTSISDLYLTCIESFQNFISTLGEDNCHVIRLEQVRIDEVAEYYARTKIWGDQTKADLRAEARGSLADTLRHNPELSQLVKGILTRLVRLLHQATFIATKKHSPELGSDYDSTSDISAESDSSLENDGKHQPTRMPRIILVHQQISEQILSLYDLSALLRRPVVADKYISSVSSKPKWTTGSNPDEISPEVAFLKLDEAHVFEKVLQWRGLTKHTRSIRFEDEDRAPSNLLVAYDVDIAWFCQRLARSNTRRREQLQYWTEHPYQSIPEKPRTVQPQEVDRTHRPATIRLEQPKSTTSKQSFSTAALSDVFDANTNVRPRTVYAPTNIGHDRSNSVPDPPKPEEGSNLFSCPYCGIMLESREMQNRQSWKRHVFRDLRPYVCTFEDCQSSDKLYLSRHDWIHHEFQMHRRQYTCNRCQENCATRTAMSTHLHRHYDNSISPLHWEVLLDLCNRSLDTFETETEVCLLCMEKLSLSVLEDHLGAHMEDISLFVLPNSPDNATSGSSKVSLKAARLGTTGKPSDIGSHQGSLNLSHSGDSAILPRVIEPLPSVEATEEAEAPKAPSMTREDDPHLENISGSIEKSELSSRALEDFKDNPDWLSSQEDLAHTHLENCQWNEAEELFTFLINTRKAMLGYDHPDTLSSMANLASTYWNQGRWDEAEKLYLVALESRKTKLGPDHPDTLTSMANLASTYAEQGRLDEAEKLNAETLECRKARLGPDHPDTLRSIANLASTYAEQGRWDEAEKLELVALESRKTKLGPDHPDTLTSMANLASTYWEQGRLDEAEQLELEVLECRKIRLGPDHPDTLSSMANLAMTYKAQGRLDEAEKLNAETLECRKARLGPDHPDTLTSVANLASTYWSQGRFHEAEKLELVALECRKARLGPEHPDTLWSMHNLACTWKEQGRLNEALELMRRCAKLRERVLGPQHPNTLFSSKKIKLWEEESHQ